MFKLVIVVTLSFFSFYLYFTKLIYKKKERQMKLIMVEIFDEIHQEISWNKEDAPRELLLLLSNYFCKSLLVEKRRFYFEIQEIKAINPKIYSLLCQLEELKSRGVE